MELTAGEKKFGKIAGLLGVLQGIVWMFISMMCIVVYYKSVKFYPEPHSFLEFVKRGIYYKYLNRYYEYEGFEPLIAPQEFIIGVWIYFFADLVWVVTSLFLIADFNSNINTTRTKAITFWITSTLTVWFIDLHISILIGVDYRDCLYTKHRLFDEVLGSFYGYHNYLSTGIIGFSITSLTQEMYCSNIIFPVLFIVNKGCVLWIINLVLVFAMVKLLKTGRIKDGRCM